MRWPPGDATRELTGEWAIAMEVLTAACESFQADPKVAEWLARAVATAEKGTAAIRGRRGKRPRPDGILLRETFGGLGPPRRGARVGEA